MWRLKDKEVERKFKEKLDLNSTEGNVEEVWQNMKNSLLMAAAAVCGWTKGQPRHKETWSCNDDVKEKVDDKRMKYQMWCKVKGSPNEERAWNDFVKSKRMAKKAVAQA